MPLASNRALSHLLSPARIATAHIDEQAFDGQHRSVYETDGDKIGFADGFRALADKTQVHDRVERDGNHRNRLTHSIEVSRVGRSLGVAVGARMISYYGLHTAPSGEAFWRVDPVDIGHIVAAACLAHDVGNPPFGHDGEDAISDFFRSHPAGLKAVKDAGPLVGAELQKHEGNAQGFRMITRSLGWRQSGGLNLTAATLGAFGKYPFPNRVGAKKYGVHHADLGTMAFVARATGMKPNGDGWCRHPLAWLMEAADDICYLTVDLEDAAMMGLIDIEDLLDLYAPVVGPDEIQRGHRMNDMPRMIQYLRSRMIKTLINACVEIYVDIAEALDTDSLRRTSFGGGILAHTRHGAAMQAIREFSKTRIYASERTRQARKGFRQTMISAMALLCDELQSLLATGDPVSYARMKEIYPTLARLPKSRHEAPIPLAADQAYPWLLDQVTLMSDAQIFSLAKSA